mgnify:CR=1 FL=1
MSKRIARVWDDFLGLRTLTIIDWALQAINEQKKLKGEKIIELDEIPLNDSKPFEFIKNLSHNLFLYY